MVPAAPGGATACSSVDDTKLTVDADAVPKVTVAPGTNPLPLIVTVPPPVVGPVVGLTLLTVGTS
jgi:hypothetical protein